MYNRFHNEKEAPMPRNQIIVVVLVLVVVAVAGTLLLGRYLTSSTQQRILEQQNAPRQTVTP
jgi:hypothetical protein